MSERTPLLVLGLGNLLLEDDGVGAAAVALLLDRYDVPAGARVLDGGTLGLSLLPYLAAADCVILVDAIRVEAGPGSLVRLEGDDVAPAVATRLSPHQVGVADLLDGARWLGRYPRHVVLLGLVPESMELAVGLSPRVRPALPVLVERIVEEAGTLGFVFCRRSADETAPVGRTVDVTAYVLGTAIRPETRILSSLPGPHSGPGRAKRAQEILETSRGLCRDIKGRALGWLGERR